VKLTFLGTGTSSGIPAVGCKCPVCTSKSPRNHRYRAGAVFTIGRRNILIDTPPELRLALLRSKISDIAAVCWTHIHADHINGIDDLRYFYFMHRKDMPCYGSRKTLDHIRRAFRYIFKEQRAGGGVPHLEFRPVSRKFRIGRTAVTPIEIDHGGTENLGYRIGKIAYLTDVKRVPEKSMHKLKGLDVLVTGALRYSEHQTHMNLDEAVELAKHIGARRTYFTHIAHDLDHEKAEKSLPRGIHIAYDGLVLKS
jgi:phosphoribosyl 1,2-cyclic phosphate phosphodiesterase